MNIETILEHLRLKKDGAGFKSLVWINEDGTQIIIPLDKLEVISE